jgi:hypothetical protein
LRKFAQYGCGADCDAGTRTPSKNRPIGRFTNASRGRQNAQCMLKLFRYEFVARLKQFEREFEWSHDTALNFMRTYEVFGEDSEHMFGI